MKFFTSDLHLHSPYVAGMRGYMRKGVSLSKFTTALDNKDYEYLEKTANWRRHDIDLMNTLKNWIKGRDELYILGDISDGGLESTEEAIRLIKSCHLPRKNLHLILGDNEGLKPSRAMLNRYSEVFGSVSVHEAVPIRGINFTLSHLPFKRDLTHEDKKRVLNHIYHLKNFAMTDDGMTLLLHGHTHSDSPFPYSNPREMSVSLDAWDMKPVSELAVVDRFESYYNAVGASH